MADNDWLGGYTLDELLGLEPVSVTDKKQGMIGRIIGAPFRLVAALIKLPFRLLAFVIKLPFRVVRAVLPPWGKGRSRRRAS